MSIVGLLFIVHQAEKNIARSETPDSQGNQSVFRLYVLSQEVPFDVFPIVLTAPVFALYPDSQDSSLLFHDCIRHLLNFERLLLLRFSSFISLWSIFIDTTDLHFYLSDFIIDS